MKKIKALTATLSLLGIIILSSTSAHAGLVVAGRTAPPNQTSVTRLANSLMNIVIGQVTGVTIRDTEGVCVSDQTTERTPVYITD